jgi:hypothetical protein
VARAPSPARTRVKMYKLIVALLAGIGLTAAAALSLNLPVTPFIMVAAFFLMPGGLADSLLFKSHGLGDASTILTFSAIFYSTIAYLILQFWLPVGDRRLRFAATAAALPVLIVACLACVPSISPIWPRGMKHLTEQEAMFRDALPLGLDLDSARTFLKSRGISVYDQEMSDGAVVFQNAHERMFAEASERVLSAKIETEAGQFPCGYRIDIVLIFNQNRRLEHRHIERFPICP